MDGISVVVDAPMEAAERALRESLVEVGFGVLTEINLSATLKEKLGEERPPMKILGACNPKFASQALNLDPTMALLLPCNVVLEEVPEGTRVTAVDPRALMRDRPELTGPVSELLQQALSKSAERV